MQTDAAVLNQVTPQSPAREQVRHQPGFIDRVTNNLEREDTVVEYLMGYGVCALTMLYLLGNLFRMLF